MSTHIDILIMLFEIAVMRKTAELQLFRRGNKYNAFTIRINIYNHPNKVFKEF